MSRSIAGVIGAVAVFALAACGGPAGGTPAADKDGMVVFACALSADLHGWDESEFDRDFPGFPLPAAVGNLFGASAGVEFEGYEEFTDEARTITMGAMQLDSEVVNSALTNLQNRCDDNGVEYAAVETTLDERAEFACDLASRIEGSGEPNESGLNAIGERCG